MQNVLTIQDLSCYSKSSLNIALPVFEAARLGCTILPTTLLSSQTDGWSNLYSTSLTAQALSITQVFDSENIKFNALQVGYLSGKDDVAIITYVLQNLLEPNALKVLDPVLADNGFFYGEDRLELVPQLVKLLQHFDLITPNYTEACILTETPYEEGELSLTCCEKLVDGLKERGAKEGVITSVKTGNGHCNIAFDKNAIYYIPYHVLDSSYPGTGDLFSTLLTSFLLKGESLKSATKKATELTTTAVRYSKECKREYKNGVLLYPVLKALIEEGV